MPPARGIYVDPHEFGSMSAILTAATPEVIRQPSGIPPGSRTGRRVLPLSWWHGGPGRTAVAAGFAGRRRAPGRDVLRHPDAPTGGPPGVRPGLGRPGRVRGRSAARSVAALAMTLMTGAMAAMFLLRTLYMSTVMEYSPLSVGIAYLLFCAVLVAALAASAPLVPRHGHRPAACT